MTESNNERENRQFPSVGHYLAFSLGSEVYALSIADIKEILDYEPLSKMPEMPSFVRGVFTLHGVVVPVVDLLAHHGKGSTRIAKSFGIVVIQTRAVGNELPYEIGVAIEEVHELLDIGDFVIEPAGDSETGVHPEFIAGNVESGHGVVMLLEIDNILSAEELVRLSLAGISHQPVLMDEIE